MTDRLTIGQVAQASGLSAKALRLYDEMGLVVPAAVDPVTGYRYYDDVQVDQARLVARLRSVGVPLARITEILARVDDGRDAAAAELLSWWRQVEADTVSARGVVATLVAHLRGQDTTMTSTTTAPRSAHRGGQGQRDAQLDALMNDQRFSTQVTGQRVFAVADGFGDGEGLADLALAALEPLDGADLGPDPLSDLDAALGAAASAVGDTASETGGTTLTALLVGDGRAYVAHVGDSRVYLVRGGTVERITRDHNAVQSLVDEGRLTDEEARLDDRRPVLNRALAAGAPFAPDLAVRTTEPGDRFVLTTDGVHAELDAPTLTGLFVAGADPEAVARAVEEAVLAAGAPDNYGIVVVDL